MSFCFQRVPGSLVAATKVIYKMIRQSSFALALCVLKNTPARHVELDPSVLFHRSCTFPFGTWLHAEHTT